MYFLKMATICDAMREPLQNLIPNIRVVAVTCNNYSPPSMPFQDWVSHFSV